MKNKSQLAFICYSGSREGKLYRVERWPVSIGRHPRNTIALEDEPTVSGFHCRVVLENDHIWVYDLKSDNGTYLNGQRIDYRAELSVNASVLGVAQVKLALIEESKPGHEEEVAAHLLRPNSILIPSTKAFRKAEEVVLVVDVAESTRIGREHGEASLVKSLWLLARVFERSARARQVLFMKCTGDGFLATFETAQQGLSVACEVLFYFVHPAHPSYELPPLRLRFGLNRGSVMINEQGDRFGTAVHLCTRLEGLKENELTPLPGSPGLPPVNRILVTDAICDDVSPQIRSSIVPLGTCIPKGFSEPVRVHAVEWEKLRNPVG